MNSITRNPRLPTFLGIGAQKSGTTWLHFVLSQHPQLYLPKRKELHFFDTEEGWQNGLEWYEHQFDGAPEGRILGEITPGYMWCARPAEGGFDFSPFREEIPQRVLQTLGRKTKLIVLFRNPIDRAVSAYIHHMAKGRINPQSERISQFRRFGIAHIGYYHSHLRAWLKVFPMDNFFFYCYEKAIQNKQLFYSDVLGFLGVKDFDTQPTDRRAQFFLDYQRVGDKVIASQDQKVIMNEGDIGFLRKMYIEEVSALAALVNIDFSLWRNDFAI